MTISVLAERLGWRLAVRTLGPDSRGNAILGDLLEMRDERARTAGPEAAARWFRREIWRSWLAFLPSLGWSGRQALIAVLFASFAYAFAVNGATLLIFQVTNSLHLVSNYGFALAYFAVVASSGAIAGYALALIGRLAPLRSAAFISLAIAFGARHVIGSAPGELWFRATKVVLFIVFGLVASLLGLASPHP